MCLERYGKESGTIKSFAIFLERPCPNSFKSRGVECVGPEGFKELCYMRRSRRILSTSLSLQGGGFGMGKGGELA